MVSVKSSEPVWMLYFEWHYICACKDIKYKSAWKHYRHNLPFALAEAVKNRRSERHGGDAEPSAAWEKDACGQER